METATNVLTKFTVLNRLKTTDLPCTQEGGLKPTSDSDKDEVAVTTRQPDVDQVLRTTVNRLVCISSDYVIVEFKGRKSNRRFIDQIGEVVHDENAEVEYKVVCLRKRDEHGFWVSGE